MRWLVACFLLLLGGSCIAETKTVSKVEFTYPDFNPCYEKNKASIVYFGKIRAVAISEKYAIAYTKEKPTIPFVKYDPLMHIYLFESSKPLIPVKLKSTTHLKLGEWLASTDSGEISEVERNSMCVATSSLPGMPASQPGKTASSAVASGSSGSPAVSGQKKV